MPKYALDGTRDCGTRFFGVKNMPRALGFYGRESAVETAELAVKVSYSYLTERYGEA